VRHVEAKEGFHFRPKMGRYFPEVEILLTLARREIGDVPK
jgi:hypothetical protein